MQKGTVTHNTEPYLAQSRKSNLCWVNDKEFISDTIGLYLVMGAVKKRRYQRWYRGFKPEWLQNTNSANRNREERRTTSTWGDNECDLGYWMQEPKWVIISSVQLLSYVQLFVTPWSATRQDSQSNTNSWSLLKLMSTESVMLVSNTKSFE